MARASLDLSYSTVVKEGYGSNLFQSSFFGLNAAINIANASTAVIKNSNITVHNGAANVYAFGTGTEAYVYDTSLYSSGPISHGLYASGNGTIYGYNIQHYSGGNRASSFSGDSPAGYIHVFDSVAHTAGVGSAICYTLGECHMTNVIGHAEKAPVLFADGIQLATLNNVDLTSDFLAGIIFFSSMTREAGAYLLLNESRLTVTAQDQPAMWWGNTIASAEIISSEINTASGILVLANRSQVTQDFDYFAGYEQNSDIESAEVIISVSESHLSGDIVAYNGSSISWSLSDYSTWTGSAYVVAGPAYLEVALDATSNWTLTKDTTLMNFTNADTTLSNVQSNGYTISYVSNSTANAWLKGNKVDLPGGGCLEPVDA